MFRGWKELFLWQFAIETMPDVAVTKMADGKKKSRRRWHIQREKLSLSIAKLHPFSVNIPRKPNVWMHIHAQAQITA